jgi:hypothetical protein
MRYRLDSDTCSGKCSSRLACPYGKDNAYGSEQIAYHHKFVLKIGNILKKVIVSYSYPVNG